jgi:ornithine cyclodeaminase
MLILNRKEVSALLAQRELDLIRIVGSAYEAHSRGNSMLPHSTFLRFPNNKSNRIIALPAYLGEGFEVAGIKWISSFPANVEKGLERASAAIILNSLESGRPEALIEGSIISAKRTAASAALAAQRLHRSDNVAPTGVIGCGPINFEITRFLLAALPERRSFVVYDLDPERAKLFKKKCEDNFNDISVELSSDIKSVIKNASVVSFATSSIEPYVHDIEGRIPGSTILHISLRDLSPQVILAGDNIVDDVDHACRAQTSVHLAEQLSGNRDFIRCTLADILTGNAPARRSDEDVAIFSPFGLGVLDLAVAKSVYELAREANLGIFVESFLSDA